MKYNLFLWMLSCIVLLTGGCRKSEGDPAPQLPEKRVSFVRSYDEAHALALQSIGLLDGVPATRGAAPRTIASGDCVVVPGTRAAGGTTDTLLYVFNFADDASFSIIAADASADPLIAVTEKGHYVYGEPTGVEPFDDYMAQLMSSKPSGPGPEIPLVPDPRPRFYQVEYDTDETVGPLLTTKWGQEGIYGAYCSNGIAGCTATAMAQIMAYYRAPSSIDLSTVIGNHWIGDTVDLDWEKMVNSESGMVGIEIVHDRIAVLMREIGNRVGMRYFNNNNISGTDNCKVNQAFRSFGYSVSDTLKSRTMSEIFSSIRAKRPALVCGLAPSGNAPGHTWVADGFVNYKCGVEYYEWVDPDPGIVGFDDPKDLSEGMYLVTSSTVVERYVLHFNWGWSGKCNGYFAFGVYDPNKADNKEYDNPDLVNQEDGNFEKQVKYLLNVTKK